ncbi:MAG: hypothetical protein L3J79_02890 [Candidatus Marinimicrobia bacterium]|nr:hypothetical protein [Candidatus Neomarinimicrobiota bacterium]
MNLKQDRVSSVGVAVGAVNLKRIGRRKGFTLIEITMYLAMSMVLSATLLLMLQSHFTFMRVLSSFEFIRDDAPQINVVLTEVFGKATSYRIYNTTSNARFGGAGVTSGGKAVVLNFRNPDGTQGSSIIGLDTTAGNTSLNFYNYDLVAGSWPASPSWTISEQVADVDFSIDQGIMLVTLTGPRNEQITYGGTDE